MKEVISQIKSLTAGDLVQVEWCDASIGKSLSNGVSGIDVPVKSWGIFIGLLGSKKKHVILAQNCFRYSDGLYDIDYTAVPVPINTRVVGSNISLPSLFLWHGEWVGLYKMI